MKFKLTTAAIAAALIAMPMGGATASGKECKRLGFLVNDYGKDGPTRDAKKLLDKHIVEWTKQRGIKRYSVGKKDVKCELFLDVIVFDEHTCTASATVCWDKGAVRTPVRADATGKTPAKKATTAKKAPAKAPGVVTGSIKPKAAPKPPAAKPAAAAKPARAPATPKTEKPAEKQ